MDIAILLYDRFTALDAIGPYEVLSRLPGRERRRSSPPRPGPVRTDNGMLTLVAERSLDELADARHRARARRPRRGRRARRRARCSTGCASAHATSTWTTSVCTGSLILAAAGLLDGKRATSHWLALERAAASSAPSRSRERVVFDGKIVTAAGVSAGIDMALALAERIAGERGRAGDPARASSTTRSRRSTRARPRRRRPRSSSCCAAREPLRAERARSRRARRA